MPTRIMRRLREFVRNSPPPKVSCRDASLRLNFRSMILGDVSGARRERLAWKIADVHHLLVLEIQIEDLAACR